MKIPLTAIVEDVSIQCRAAIDMELVQEYAGAMTEGEKFPPLAVFGDAKRCWIGDGWHRYTAAKQNQFRDIEVDLMPGGRIEALRFALKANSTNGLRRSNADKRRAVEIALKEFASLSSRQIAELCGVSNHMVDNVRPQALGENPNATRTTSDGRQYPATRPASTKQTRPADPAEAEESAYLEGKETEQEEQPIQKEEPKPKRGMGVQYANEAIAVLQKIRPDDPLRKVGLDTVVQWIKANR